MSVKENLIAAKATWIDKGHAQRSNPLNSIRDSIAEEQDRIAAYNKLRTALPAGHKYVMQWLRDARPTHAEIMALFDRAIAAADDSP